MLALTILCLISLVTSQQKKTVTVGIAAVENVLPDFMGHSQSAGAIGLALDRMQSEGIAGGIEFRFLVNYTECDAAEAVGVAVDFMVKENVDVVIAPPCPMPAVMMGHLSTHYKKTLLGWGFLTDSRFSDSESFPYLTKVTPDSLQMMRSVLQLFSTFNWNRVAIYYSPNEVQYCDGIIDDASTAFSDESTYYVDVVQKVVWDRVDNKYLSDQLQRTKNLARIVVLCLDTGKDRRTFAKRAHALDMASEEYVYVLLGTRGFGFGQSMGGGLKELSNGLTPFWEDLLNNHTDDAVVKEVARRMLTVDINIEGVSSDALKEFSRNVVPRVRRDPLFCSTEACLTNDGKPMSVWARHLHDVFYLYGLSLNQSLAVDPIGGQSNATVLGQSMQRTFLGLTGLVTIDENGTRVPLFTVYGLDDNYNQIAFINFTLNNGTPVMSKSYTDEATTIWQTRGGERPLARPLCGYSGRDCPKAFWELYTIYVAVGAALIGATLVAVITILVVLIRIRRAERQRERMLWQVPHLQLRRPPSLRAEQSKPSLQSGRSAVTGDSRFTSEAKFGRYEIYILGKDPVLTSKYPPSILTENDYSRFSQMSKLHHDNVNRFVGLSIDGAQYLAVWRMCTRGTLQELITNGSLAIDAFFMFCIIKDIAEGMRFLHTSSIGCHGRLRSGCCMVTENWQVKISDYGTESLLEEDRAKRKRLLWTAPEHLRAGERSSQASKEGDIFSFAIISSEVVTRRGAWNLYERKEQMDGISRPNMNMRQMVKRFYPDMVVCVMLT